jgi:pimeloyl-ACP methyl ester carboxylesterase
LIFSCSFVRNPSKALSVLSSIVPLLPIHGVLPNAVRNLLLGINSKEVRELVDASLSKVAPEVIRGRLEEVLSVDVTTSLQRVSAPILYLRASDDRLVKRRSGEYIQQIMPSTQIVEIGGSHLLLQSEPNKCAATISEFLNPSTPTLAAPTLAP